MSTESVANEIKLKAANWSLEGEKSIHAMMDRAQRHMFSEPCARSIYVDPLTGQHPFLPVTIDIFTYDLPDISKTINGIARTLRFTRCMNLYILVADVTDYGQLNEYNRYIRQKWIRREGDKFFFEFDPETSTQTDPARVSFKHAPKATDAELYRHISLIEPLRLTDSAIPLMVAEDWEAAIIDGSLGYIEYYDYGNSDRLQTFYEYWCPRFWDKENKHTQLNKPTTTPIRNF